MTDFMAPSQAMGQQLQGVLHEAAASADQARTNLAAKQLEQQRMAKEMEVNYTLADRFMSTNKPLALEYMNAFLKPTGREVTLDDIDQAKPFFDQANEFRQKGDMVGMKMALTGADKYLVNTTDRNRALSMQREADSGIANQQAQTIRALQPENPQLARAKSLVDLAGMVGGDLTKVQPDQLVALTGTTDPTEQNNRLIQSQAMLEGNDARTKYLATLFYHDQSSFVQAAHATAQSIANPEAQAKWRISDLLQKPDRTDAEERELRGKSFAYGSPQLQAAMQVQSAQRDAEQVRSQLEDTQSRLSALQTHGDFYLEAQRAASSITDSTKGLPDAGGPLTDDATRQHVLAEGTREAEGKVFLSRNENGELMGKAAGRIQSLEQTATEAERQTQDLKQRQLGALPGQKDMIASQLKEFDAMSKANRAQARLLRDENPYAIEQIRADLAQRESPEAKAAVQDSLTALETQRDKDLGIVEAEKARLERREKILRGKQPEADRKEEYQANLISAHQAVDKMVAKGIPLSTANTDAAKTFGVDPMDLAKSVKAARGLGVPEAQITLLSAAQDFRRKNGRAPEPGEVQGLVRKVMKQYAGITGDDIMPVLKDMDKPGVQVNVDLKQNVQESGKLANINQSISEMQQVRQILTNPDGTINRLQLFAGSLGLPFTEGRSANQFMQKATEIKLRAATGAAARPEEMKMYMSLFSPSNFDSDDTIKYKLDSFENWLQTVADTTDPGGSLRKRATEMMNQGTVGLLQTPAYKELRTKFPQASSTDIVKFLQKRGQ